MNNDDKYALDLNKEPERKVAGIEAQCWTCSAIWNISLLPPDAKAVKCICGGYVVTPSGKALTRPVVEGMRMDSPLLRLDTYDPKEQLIAKRDVKGEIAGKMTTELDELMRSGKESNMPEPILTRPDAEMMEYYERLKKHAIEVMGIPRELIEGKDLRENE